VLSSNQPSYVFITDSIRNVNRFESFEIRRFFGCTPVSHNRLTPFGSKPRISRIVTLKLGANRLILIPIRRRGFTKTIDGSANARLERCPSQRQDLPGSRSTQPYHQIPPEKACFGSEAPEPPSPRVESQVPLYTIYLLMSS